MPGQLVSFICASNYFTEIYFLLQIKDELQVYCLEKRQPFKKFRLGEHYNSDFEFRQKRKFILKTNKDFLQKEIKKVEYINDFAPLIVQTTHAIWAIGRNGSLEKLSTLTISTLPMQRGYGDAVYWVEKHQGGTNDEVLRGVKIEEIEKNNHTSEIVCSPIEQFHVS